MLSVDENVDTMGANQYTIWEHYLGNLKLHIFYNVAIQFYAYILQKNFCSRVPEDMYKIVFSKFFQTSLKLDMFTIHRMDKFLFKQYKAVEYENIGEEKLTILDSMAEPEN